jgi:hypothetical protein
MPRSWSRGTQQPIKASRVQAHWDKGDRAIMVDVVCMYCGRTLKRHPSQISAKIFCSREEAQFWLAENPRRIPDDVWYAQFKARAMGRVDRSMGPEACWPWMAQRDKDGYGVIYDRRVDQNQRAHRILWEITGHEPLEPGVLLLHKCDNPPCCNDAHLFPGTITINNRDRSTKGRWKGNPKKRVMLVCHYAPCSQPYEVTQCRALTSKFHSVLCKAQFQAGKQTHLPQGRDHGIL